MPKKLRDVVPLNELSPTTLKSYRSKATASQSGAESRYRKAHLARKDYDPKEKNTDSETVRKRRAGRNMATKKLGGALTEGERWDALKKAYKDKSGRFQLGSAAAGAAGLNLGMGMSSPINAAIGAGMLGVTGALKGADIVSKYRKNRREQMKEGFLRALGMGTAAGLAGAAVGASSLGGAPIGALPGAGIALAGYALSKNGLRKDWNATNKPVTQKATKTPHLIAKKAIPTPHRPMGVMAESTYDPYNWKKHSDKVGKPRSHGHNSHEGGPDIRGLARKLKKTFVKAKDWYDNHTLGEQETVEEGLIRKVQRWATAKGRREKLGDKMGADIMIKAANRDNYDVKARATSDPVVTQARRAVATDLNKRITQVGRRAAAVGGGNMFVPDWPKKPADLKYMKGKKCEE